MRIELLVFLLSGPLRVFSATCLGRSGSPNVKVTNQGAESPSSNIGIDSAFPGKHPHHPPEKEPTGTVYEVLSSDPKFSKLTKALNFVDEVAALLNDTSAMLTFFATPDHALRPPERDDYDRDIYSDAFKHDVDQNLFELTDFINLSQAIDLLDRFEQNGAPEDDDNKRKRILKFILRSILEYHIVPKDAYDGPTLGHNTTYATNLTIPPVLDGEPLRLRVSQKFFPPVTAINFFSKIVQPSTKATNGIIHVVDHPLLPPPPVFQELYLIPHFFSTLTSALQRSELTEALDLRFVHGKGLQGASLVTVFAPTNRAFDKLPQKLKFFLFSPFGARILKKILQYHIVPDVAVYSDYLHHKSALEPKCEQVLQVQNTEPDQSIPWYLRFEDHRHDRRPAEPLSSVNVTLETLFTNHTLQAHIERTNVTLPIPGPRKPSWIETKVFVNHQLVAVPDIVALNGAIHVVDALLDPRGPKHGRHEGDHDEENGYDEDSHVQHDEIWGDWEEWLLQWANEN